MLTHASRLRANETDREVGLHRSIDDQGAGGEGCWSLLSEDQLAGFAHRVRMLAHMSRRSPASVVYSVGLRGEAAAQVLAALEAE
jgi:hypothetical protein